MKRRADLILVEHHLAPNRSRALALLLGGRVYWGEKRIDKPGAMLPANVELTVREGEPFVSRGGTKLAAALAELGVDVKGALCADLGASTGGFVDCLLRQGAARVYAIDVGHGQLSPKLRDDLRVVVMEQTNARYLKRSDFADAIDLVTLDLSFIGIAKVMPAVSELLCAGGKLVALIKPQFEAGRSAARRAKGVIRAPEARELAIQSARAAIREAGFEIVGECDSVLRGPKGNLERFAYARRQP
jgi:23S rRNA (cytidine1920-2'-O)/16S rRNA (cytidine1409-2'-O)-methyltransferase